MVLCEELAEVAEVSSYDAFLVSVELLWPYPTWRKLQGGLPRMLKKLCILNGQDYIGILSEEQVEVAVKVGDLRLPTKDKVPESWTPDKWLTTKYGLCCNVNLHLIR